MSTGANVFYRIDFVNGFVACEAGASQLNVRALISPGEEASKIC
jgi:hypothetical protein